LAGYEDVNDADRLCRDPAMRWVVGDRAITGAAVSASQMGRFETKWLSRPENLGALADLAGQWINKVHQRRPPRIIVLDMDSSENPTYGEQEGSAYNGHFGCTCYTRCSCSTSLATSSGARFDPGTCTALTAGGRCWSRWSPAVLGWRLSNTLGADFCVEVLQEASARQASLRSLTRTRACPSEGWGLPVHRHRVHRRARALRGYDQHGWQKPAPAKAGGRCMDNIFIERLWRSLKYEEVYLDAYASVAEAKAGIGSGSASTTRGGSTRASAIARRSKSIRRNACGDVDNRLRRPAALPSFPEHARKTRKCSPLPTSPQAQQPTKDLIWMIRKVKSSHQPSR
jgi:DDE family transposase